MEKIYKVKPSYETTVRKLSGHQLRSESIVFVEGSNLHNELLLYNVLDLFCEEVPKEAEQWVEPQFWRKTKELPLQGLYGKAHLLIRMQSWADYHNNLDRFVADWSNNMQKKYGVVIEDRITSIQPRQTYNGYLFQICVGTESRAAIMHGYFHKDIQSLIDKGLI